MNRRIFRVFLLAVQALAAGAAVAQDAPAASPLGDAAKRLVSLDVQEVTARELSAQLSNLAGVPVVYAPAQGPGESGITLQVRDFPLGVLVASLAKQGGVVVAGRDFVPAPAAGFDQRVLRQKVSISAKDVNAAGVSHLLSGLLGTPVEWNVPDEGMRLNLDLKEVAVQDVLKQLEKIGELSVQGLSL